MKQAGHITVTRLTVSPGLFIESTKVNVFAGTEEYAVSMFLKALLWNKAIMKGKP